MEKIQTIIIGGGQAGLSTSYFLCQRGHEHLVLERDGRTGSVWRKDRWDSFTLLTPNWSIKLPGMTYNGNNPDGFMTRNELVAYLEKYIENFDLPVQYNTLVTEVTQLEDSQGYLVKTNDKTFQAKEDDYPIQQRGVTQYPGLYFIGMSWLHKRKSPLLMGVGEDADYIASHITE
jgi:putative flavoprotein involved in K+ transport